MIENEGSSSGDFLTRLVDRALERRLSLVPRLPGIFEPLQAQLPLEQEIPRERVLEGVRNPREVGEAEDKSVPVLPDPQLQEPMSPIGLTPQSTPMLQSLAAERPHAAHVHNPPDQTSLLPRSATISDRRVEWPQDTLNAGVAAPGSRPAPNTPQGTTADGQTQEQAAAAVARMRVSDREPEYRERVLSMHLVDSARGTTAQTSANQAEDKDRDGLRSSKPPTSQRLEKALPSAGILVPNGTIVQLNLAGTSTVPEPRQFDAPSKLTEPTIKITIGRVEVRAVPEPAATRAQARRPLLSLEDYLRQRGGKT